MERLSGLLHTKQLESSDFQLQEELAYLINGVLVRAKKLSVTDFSSFPWLSRLIIRFSKVACAGAIHDSIFKTGLRDPDDPTSKCSLKEANVIWKIIAEHGEKKANPVQAGASWIGLTLGGWRSWLKYRKLDS